MLRLGSIWRVGQLAALGLFERSRRFSASVLHAHVPTRLRRSASVCAAFRTSRRPLDALFWSLRRVAALRSRRPTGRLILRRGFLDERGPVGYAATPRASERRLGRARREGAEFGPSQARRHTSTLICSERNRWGGGVPCERPTTSRAHWQKLPTKQHVAVHRCGWLLRLGASCCCVFVAVRRHPQVGQSLPRTAASERYVCINMRLLARIFPASGALAIPRGGRRRSQSVVGVVWVRSVVSSASAVCGIREWILAASDDARPRRLGDNQSVTARHLDMHRCLQISLFGASDAWQGAGARVHAHHMHERAHSTSRCVGLSDTRRPWGACLEFLARSLPHH